MTQREVLRSKGFQVHFLDQVVATNSIQSSASTISLVDAVLGWIKSRPEYAEVTRVRFQTDNANCYNSDVFVDRIRQVAASHELIVEDLIHNESQRGKTTLDNHFGVVTRVLKRAVDFGEMLYTPSQVAEAIVGIKNSSVMLCHLFDGMSDRVQANGRNKLFRAPTGSSRVRHVKYSGDGSMTAFRHSIICKSQQLTLEQCRTVFKPLLVIGDEGVIVPRCDEPERNGRGSLSGVVWREVGTTISVVTEDTDDSIDVESEPMETLANGAVFRCCRCAEVFDDKLMAAEHCEDCKQCDAVGTALEYASDQLGRLHVVKGCEVRMIGNTDYGAIDDIIVPERALAQLTTGWADHQLGNRKMCEEITEYLSAMHVDVRDSAGIRMMAHPMMSHLLEAKDEL